MIPNIETGKSFRGAELYYLHDKRGAGEALRLSDDRVAWAATRNSAHDAAHDAFAEMIAVAHDQDRLKLESGVRLSGRTCEQPVMTISLAWHPSEKPNRDQMERAADSYLRHMGWDEHQAVYVTHNDTAHPHLHIILNRIHPETGKVLDDAFSKNRSQEWARDYEREHGHIWCEERIGKDYGRADGKEPGGLPHDYAIDAREAQRPYLEREEAAQTQDEVERAQLARHHQDEREAFFETRHQQFREARQDAYREVRDEYKEPWVAHFREADRQRQDARTDADALARRALDCARGGDFAGAWEALADRAALTDGTEQQIAEERRELRADQRAETRERQDQACAVLYEERAQAFIDIKQRQKEERAELKELQAARADHQAHDPERLNELLTMPPADRLAEPSRTAESHVFREEDRNALDFRQLEAEATAELAASPTLTEHRLEGRDAEPERGRSESDPIADAGEHVAGGIGKVAEVLANAISNFINPPSPQEQAMEKALDAARDEREAERQPLREQQDRELRMVVHENQRTATDPSETFFNEHAQRIQREWDERQRQRGDRERDR